MAGDAIRRSTVGFEPGETLSPIRLFKGHTAIGNLRAEPTTEWVRKKRYEDVQPYEAGDWLIVHNGTVANDKALAAHHGLTPPTIIDSWVIAGLLDRYNSLEKVVPLLVGSYAIVAVNVRQPNVLHFAMNYRPLYLHKGHTLSSVSINEWDTLLPPYSIGTLSYTPTGPHLHINAGALITRRSSDKALVVCSGGLDSTVAAAALKHSGMEIELLHFDYGCRATQNEKTAVQNIAKRMDVRLHIVETPIFTDIIKGSPLTGTGAIAESEAGAEFAHEWVPARNLILTSIAVGIAESRGINVLALGANLEEAGAYPDNEPEFLKRFGQLLPFTVRAGTDMRIETPVGNLMKHEIVSLGLAVNAPMDLTWSCYNAGNAHCGHCGPCFMRRTAFEINGKKDPVFS